MPVPPPRSPPQTSSGDSLGKRDVSDGITQVTSNTYTSEEDDDDAEFDNLTAAAVEFLRNLPDLNYVLQRV